MITELTLTQEAQLETYTKEWIAIGTSTDRIDLPKATKAVQDLYKSVGLREPEVLLFPSPMAALEYIDEEDPEEADQKKEAFIGGGLWSGYYGYEAYISEVLKVDTEDKLSAKSVAVARQVSYWWAFENQALLANRPVEIHGIEAADGTAVSHRDGGPSILWEDGEACWSLNGVTVPQWLVMTPAQELDPKKYAGIMNVEVKREFLRKMGVERFVDKIGAKAIDAAGDYELLLIDLGGETGFWPYLKMMNPSINVYHIEAVGEKCRTVEAALTFRNGTPVRPGTLT